MSGFPYEAALLLRLVMALGCGFLLGYERERHGISAGLRTNMLVCLGAALMMVVSKYFSYKPGEDLGGIAISLDPSRIAAQIVTGVGFLGAGVIIKDKGSIRGLTTAATLWFNAGVGMALGGGMVLVPLSCTAMALVSLSALKRLDRKIRRDVYRIVSVTCLESQRPLEQLLDFFVERGVAVQNLGLRRLRDGIAVYTFTLKCNRPDVETVACVRELADFAFVRDIRLD